MECNFTILKDNYYYYFLIQISQMPIFTKTMTGHCMYIIICYGTSKIITLTLITITLIYIYGITHTTLYFFHILFHAIYQGAFLLQPFSHSKTLS